MRARARLVAVVAAAALGAGTATGCVYYNGMYNAERAAAEADRFVRQGRLAEAGDRWQRAIVHAESVAVRHPDSRYAADALLLRGRGLIFLERYSDAVTDLQETTRRARPGLQRALAYALLGQAFLAIGNLDQAAAALDTALALDQRPVRGQALLVRGRVRVALGQPEAALADFTASDDPRAAFERARTWLSLRDTTAALVQLDALVGERPYDERAWRGVLDSLGALGGAESASRLAGRLDARGDLTRGQRARLLLDDGDRARSDGADGLARARYGAAAQAAPDSVEARLASVRETRLALAAAQSDADLDEAQQRLVRIAADGGAPGREAQPTIRLLDRIARLTQDAEAPDARWFVRAELLRDSLRSRGLAARAFAAMGARYPASPWTPKALLAAIAADHPAADSLRGVLDGRYAASPYRRSAAGVATAAEAELFRTLEDSLQRLSVVAYAQRAPDRRPTPEGQADEPGRGRLPAPDTPRPAAPRPTPPPTGDRPRDIPPEPGP